MVSVRWVVPVLLLVTATAALAQPQSSRPPRDLHRVGDHYTPYNPPDPTTYPAGAKTHEIKAGDTLWALAQQYYGNAYLWPQLWESNTWITDAHWIPLARELAADLGVNPAVRFLRSGPASMPSAAGVFRPAVIMPADADAWPEGRLRRLPLRERARRNHEQENGSHPTHTDHHPLPGLLPTESGQ